MSSKMIPKAYPEEKLGHFCIRGGKVIIVEYSDLPMALQRETDPAGQLRYQSGSIAIHLLDREFIRRQGGDLPFHRADKKIPTIDAAGSPVKPDRPNGVKFEMFVFDALPFARQPLVIETRRSDDFSPVKNAEGVDSPQTCREDQIAQFGRWLTTGGAAFPKDSAGRPEVAVEVSPLFGYDEDTFAERWAALAPKPAVTEGLYLE
jgi:UDP-N-acetylglucosamine/UDP-N-acetylgalactosamine diphosphorylase